MASDQDYHFTSSSDYSGSAYCRACDGCGHEIGCLTPAKYAARTFDVSWQEEPAVLCDRCLEEDDR